MLAATNPHSRVAFLPLVHIRLKCLKPKTYTAEPTTIGEHIKKRRMELGLSQPHAGTQLNVSAATVLNWEKGMRVPLITQLGGIIAFLGYYPFPEPTTIADRLLRARRENGWSVARAAERLGVDPSTWCDWEKGELILYRKHRVAVASLLRIDERALNRDMAERWCNSHRSD